MVVRPKGGLLWGKPWDEDRQPYKAGPVRVLELALKRVTKNKNDQERKTISQKNLRGNIKGFRWCSHQEKLSRHGAGVLKTRNLITTTNIGGKTGGTSPC